MKNKVPAAMLGLTALGVAIFGGAVAARLTDTHDVACFNAELRTWDVFVAGVTVRHDGDWLVLRKGFPPRTVGRIHKAVLCVALLSGVGE